MGEQTKSEVLQCFRRGFSHGVRSQAQDNRCIGHQRADIRDAYHRGYEKGREAMLLYSADECTRLDYDPRMSVLRGPVIEAPTSECLHSWVKLDDVRMCRQCGAPYKEQP